MSPASFANLLLIVYAVCELVSARRTAAAQRRADVTEQAAIMLLMVACVAGVLAINTEYLAGPALPPVTTWIGLGIGTIGVGLRLWAMQTLGHGYSRALTPANAATLHVGGPYRFLRHPGYLGDILTWSGATLSARSGLALLVVAGLIIGVCVMRIRAEDSRLAARFGTAYERYRTRTARLLPGFY